jgi:copper oxidase (laccase) domain-containing protein
METRPAQRPRPGALESALLAAQGFSHAFFTRQGGVSQPPWDSLNFAISVGDDAACVRENRERAAAELGSAKRGSTF